MTVLRVVTEPHFMPFKAYESDAGYDLFVSEPVSVPPSAFRDVRLSVTGIVLPEGYWGRLVGRSSTLRRRGLLVPEGVIDGGYTGPLFAGVFNLTNQPVAIERGDRIAQLILCPLVEVPVERVEVHEIPATERGSNGFGSSGGHALPE